MPDRYTWAWVVVCAVWVATVATVLIELSNGTGGAMLTTVQP